MLKKPIMKEGKKRKFPKHKFKRQTDSNEASRRGRLIIRNLPFNVTDDALRNHFQSYGNITDMNILKRPDGKLVGCGFVQYDRKQSAAKAIHYTSGKQFLGRVIIVDWAISKNKFSQSNKSNEKEIKNERLNESSQSATDVTDTSVKEEADDSSDSESIESKCSEESNAVNKVPHDEPKPLEERPKPKASHDIPEGKTVFLKNVSFNVSNDELKEFVETIGPVYYAVVCFDPLTEHSKGTAFVKFKNKAHADKCLESGTDLTLKGCTMLALPALDKKKLNSINHDKHPDKKKDNRNLYLVKEGAVIAGTKAAIGVSMTDMRKRLELELWKSNMLKNLNMFISNTRLIIHNLPASYDDAKLRELFKKNAPPKSRIIEAKVMKNMYQLDNEGKPTSKGYGFVSFIEHKDALTALRKINNNPSIFHPNKRPIVAFSIENRSVIQVKQKRAEKSKLNNPLCPQSKKPRPEEPKREKKIKRRMRSENVPTFAGIESHPGQTSLPSKRKIFSQQEVHSQNVKEVKRDRKRKQQALQMRKEKKKEPKAKPKKKDKKDDVSFVKLVDKYRKQISPNLKKWYDNK